MTLPLHNEIGCLSDKQNACGKGFAPISECYKGVIKSPHVIDTVDIVNTNIHKRQHRRAGFTLIELMVVMVIMVVMLALSAPALSAFKNTVGRKGAINQLLNTFEQARVAALTEGATVYVCFADASADIPSSLTCKAFIVLRERVDSDPANSPKFVALTGWMFLPKGISFQKVNGDNSTLMSDACWQQIDPGCLPLLNKSKQISLPALVFNSSGYIETPGKYLRLLIYEGFQGPNGPSFTNPSNTKFDVIAFRRFSGRAELFLTAGS